MKHFKLFLCAAALLLTATLTMSNAQQKRYAVYAIGFYNVENLFDTIHDRVVVDGKVVEDKNDYEYLPDGANHWNTEKYQAKIHNMAYAISKMATDKLPKGPALIGLSEVENEGVLRDLLSQPELKDRGWKYVDIAGADRRGIECALLYNPRMFKFSHVKMVPYVYPPEDNGVHITRGFLTVTGRLAGEEVNVIVCHWPSRGATSPVRERAGRQVKAIKDSLLALNPDTKVIVMGDLNDDPDNRSLQELGAKRSQKDVKRGDFWNPWWDTLRKQGVGTLKYDGKWNLFDQIVLSWNFLGNDDGTLKYWRHEVFNRDFLTQQEGQYKGSPKRTFAKGVWLNGYSDHYPTLVYLRKEVK